MPVPREKIQERCEILFKAKVMATRSYIHEAVAKTICFSDYWAAAAVERRLADQRVPDPGDWAAGAWARQAAS